MILGYLLVVGPLVGLSLAAVRPPGPAHLVLLLGGPVLAAAAAGGVPGVERLGWVAVIGIPYAYLLVLPVLPWRRRWARVAIPAVVLVDVGLAVAVGRADAPVLFFAAFPACAALVGLVVAARSRRPLGSAE